MQARLAHDGELARTLARELRTRDAEEWEKLFVPRGVACVAVFEKSHAAFHVTEPALRETGHTVEVDHSWFGPILRHGLPAQFSETPGRIGRSGLAGEHTRSVLSGLGYRDEEIDDLVAKGHVAAL